jgi:hypothetical protein
MLALRPPRGRFSHLAMFRLGTLLFIPGYVTVILYRVLASPQGNGGLILMIRECHLRLLSCTAYQSVSYTSFDHQHVSGIRFVVQCP